MPGLGPGIHEFACEAASLLRETRGWSCQAQCCPAGILRIDFSSFPSWPDEDPAIQICFRAADLDLDHRVSPLRGGPVMTEKNQASLKNGIYCLRFSCRTAVCQARP
jgi:hypothetical protein